MGIDMAVIDTLKLARALRDKAGFDESAAEATAEAINDALGAQMASKANLDQAVERIDHRLDQAEERLDHKIDQAVERIDNRITNVHRELKSDFRFLQWQVGIVGALQIITIVPGAWLLLKMAAKLGIF